MHLNTSILELILAPAALAALTLPFTANSQGILQKKHLYGDIIQQVSPCPPGLTGRSVTADSLSLPSSQSLYIWSEPGQWHLELYSTYTYLQNGNLDTNVNYYNPGGDPFNEVVYSYDSLYRINSLTVQKFDSIWLNNSKFEYSYDEHNNPASQLNYIWFGNAWQVTTGNRMSYTYDSRPFITKKVSEKYNVLQYWSFDEKTEYIFQRGDQPSELVTYDWNQIEWAPRQRLLDIDWKSYDGEHATGEFNAYVQENWDQVWVSDLRRTYVYGQNSSFEFTEEVFRNDSWVYDNKYEEIRDENSMLLEVKNSVWENEAWEQVDGYRYTYIIDGIDLLEILLETWDTGGADYIYSEKVVYADFIHFLDLEESETIEKNPKVYPNPAFGHICVDPGQVEITEISLFNGLGQLVQTSRVLSGDKIRIDISGLPNGLYHLVLFNGGIHVDTKKVIKF
jgi:hypothetical protein